MNGAFLGNLQQPSTLPLVQRSEQLDAQLDPMAELTRRGLSR